MMPVELRNAQRGWRLGTRALRRDAQRLLEAVGCPGATLSLLLAGDRQMSQLNERWMGRKGPTDVLTFPQQEVLGRGAGGGGRGFCAGGFGFHFPRPWPLAPGPLLLGDVALSVETARRRSPGDPEQEIRRYLVHGLLHLIGHDHAKPRERRLMDQEANRLFKQVLQGHDP